MFHKASMVFEKLLNGPRRGAFSRPLLCV